VPADVIEVVIFDFIDTRSLRKTIYTILHLCICM
jgi:hypothetical protein